MKRHLWYYFPFIGKKMELQCGDKKYRIPKSTLDYWLSKGFSALSVEKNSRFEHVFILHSNSNLRENSIILQAIFCGIFGVEFGQHSFELTE
jgi:hypothetical protein